LSRDNALSAEQAVIGSLLIDPRCLPEVAALLRPEDLALQINQDIYRAILRLEQRGSPIDAALVREEAKVSSQYLLEVMQITPTAANVVEYAKLTRDHALRRGLTDLCDRAKARIEGQEDTQVVLSDLLRETADLQQEGTSSDLMTSEEAALRFLDHRLRVESGEAAAYVPTGYRDLDYLLGGGMLDGGMYILAARPGMGKTTLALNIADRVAKRGGGVLFVSLEMDDEQITAKRLARESGISGSRLLMDPALTDEELHKVARANDAIRCLPLSLNIRPTATVDEIDRMAHRIQGLRLIVIDYLGKISPGARGQQISRYEYTTEISGRVKDLARKYKIPVLLLAQLNREVEKRSDHKPQLADLRDTGAVEQDADGVIFLYREAYYGDEERRDRYAPEAIQVSLAKNRHGGVGSCELAFAMATSKVTSTNNDPRQAYRQMVRAGEG
jgi:replicative DNA helicase